jgi:hypothetical protein
MRKKALLAVAFVSGLLNPAIPVVAQNASKSSDQVIEQVAESPKLTPELRAYCLLLIASRYLAGNDNTAVNEQFTNVAAGTASVQSFFSPRNKLWDFNLVSFADQVSRSHATIQRIKKLETVTDPLSISDQNVVLADAAINKALSILDQTSDKFAKWNMYFIAMRLFQTMDNVEGTQKCDKILEAAFQSCEDATPVPDDQRKAAVSVLNSMANGIIFVPIPEKKTDYDPPLTGEQLAFFTESDVLASEKLKLRAAAIADRLPITDDLRRKTHRDLALWYAKLGKEQMSVKQKEVLFELVGIKDDRILYPYVEGCAFTIWWVTHRTGTTTIDCGRG